jgi:hypothetical protein
MSRWYFDPILESYPAVIGLATALALLLLVTPNFRRLPPRRLAILLALRGLLIAGVLVAMLRPTRISTSHEPQSASLIILYDQSRSLLVTDAVDGQTRWQSLSRTLRDSASKLAELSDIFDVKAYSFDGTSHVRKIEDGLIDLPTQPTGDQTDIGAALDNAVSQEVGKRVAGVILLSDGAQRSHRPTVELQQTVREMARLGYPLYTIAFGRPREQSQARDVSVQNLQDQYTVFVKNELVIRGTVMIQGFVNKPIQVQMHLEDAAGKDHVIGSTELTATEDGEQARFEFRYTPEEAGQYQIEVVAQPQPGELVTDNNRLSAFLNVLEGGLRVLMLNGNLLGAEQQILRQSIGSSPDIQLDEKRIDLRLRDEWPVDLREELEQNYDVFLLADVDAAAIGDENARKIVEQVAGGKGFMMTGGFHSFGPGHYAKSPLAAILPISMDRFEGQDLEFQAAIRTDLHVPGPLQMMPTSSHFLTRLAGDSDNEQIWSRLKPLDGANQFTGIDPRATIYARADTGVPLLVGRQYDQGRVLAFAADSTHRWWRFGDKAQHKRFWRQAMLWLAKKDESQNQDVWISLERRRFRPGDSIRFSLGAKGIDGDPIPDAVLKAEMVYPTGDRQPIAINPDEDHWAGSWDETLPAGEYQIDASATQGGSLIGEASGKFIVIQEDLELTDPAANIDQMESLARLTSQAGGRSLAPEQLPQLLEDIRRSPPEMHVEIESRWQLGDTNLDAATFFLFALCLMSGEWFLRKRWGLV